MKYSLAIALLLSSQSASGVAINSKTSLDLEQTTLEAEKLNESANSQLGRFINSKGEAVNPKDTGYHKIELIQQKKFKTPQDKSTLQTGACVRSDGDESEFGEGACKIAKSGDGAMVHIPQKNLDDNVYIGELFVGTPPQKVRAVFDTGSTNTWILNKKTDVGAEKMLSYDNEASSTSKKLQQKAIISFGSGKLAGHFYTDDIRMGTCSSGDKGLVIIKDQMFGNVEKQKTIFTGSNFEGIVGLGYPALAEKGVKPVFDGMMDQKLLKNNMFAFSFAAGDSGSDLTLGYYDKQKFTGEIAWNEVLFKYMYGVKLDDLKINGKSIGACQDKDCLITFDSGTSLMSVPSFASELMNNQNIPTFGSKTKCSGNKDYGDLTFVIGGKDYTLTNNEWMFPEKSSSFAQIEQINPKVFGPIGPELRAEDGSELIQHEAKGFSLAQSKELPGKGNSVCESMIQKMDIAKDQFLVGAVFMRKFYTIFDRDNDKVGLATASGGSGASGATDSALSEVTSLTQTGGKNTKESRKNLKKALKNLNW